MKDRINEAYRYLVYQGVVSSQLDVSIAMSINKTTVSLIMKGNEKYLTKSFIRKFCNTFTDFNDHWLLTGEGKMLKSAEDSFITLAVPTLIDSERKYETAIKLGLKMLPEVEFEFSAGLVQLGTGAEQVDRYWYLPDCTDCDAIAMVSGASMMPNLPSGCFVALKRYGFSQINTIPFGNVFGIVVEDGDTGIFHGHIKILRRHSDSQYIIARSYNREEFDDFDIEVSQIRSLWVVKQHIVSDMN